MAFPAGRLPTSQDLTGTRVPHRSVAFAGAGADMDLTAAVNNVAPCAHDFYCTTAGNLVAQLAGDSAPQTYAVTVGQVLLGAFVLLKGTSTASGIARQYA